MLGGASGGKWGRYLRVNDADTAVIVDQRGTGLISDFQDAGVSRFSIADGGLITLGGAIAGGDQSWTNVGDMTFAAGSIIASGGTNGNTLLLKANDTTCITLTTGATDKVDLAAVNTLVAIANLDIGAFDLRAATITADGLTSGRVVFAGANGVLSDDGDFTFAVDTLTIAKIAPFILTKDSIGATPTDGIALVNATDAAAGAQQYSPSVRWRGEGWKTDDVAASQTVDFQAHVRPIQGTANPTGALDIAASVNGGAYSTALSVLSGGGLGDTLFGAGAVRVKLSSDVAWAYIGTATTPAAIVISETGNVQFLGVIPQSAATYDFGGEGTDWANVWARTGIYLASTEATAGATLKDSGSLIQRAHHWNDASIDWDFAMKHTMVTAGASPKSYETFKINAVQALILGNNAGAPLLGFYALAAPIALQTGVAVTIAAVHAALVALNLITA